MRRRRALHPLLLPLLAVVVSLLPLSSSVRPFVIVISGDDLLKDPPTSDSLPSSDPSASEDHDDGGDDWDEFSSSSSSSSSSPAPPDDLRLDPGSWLSVLDPSYSASLLNNSSSSDPDPREALFLAGIDAMLAAASAADHAAMLAAASQIEAAAAAGLPHAHSALAFLRGYGVLRPLSRPRAFLHHRFAADGGIPQSKMALAYSYFRQAVSPQTLEFE